MNLENYWKILACSAYKKAKWSFYSNGWFSAQTEKALIIFDNEGNQFSSLPIETDIYDMLGGWIAIGSTEKGCWKFYDRQKNLVADTMGNTMPLRYGWYCEKFPNGETWLISLISPTCRLNLGYGVNQIVTGADGRFAYSQVIRQKTIWHLCQEKDGNLVKNDILFGITKIEILADGGYILFAQNNSVRVFNRLGQRIFSCNHQKVNFRIVGDTQISAYNSKAYRGVYSTTDGCLLLPEPDVSLYWNNGAYYSPSIGFVFAGYNGLLGNKIIYQCCRFTDELAVVRFRGKTFVINTEQPAMDLRRQLCNILFTVPTDEREYALYLTEFLLMII